MVTTGRSADAPRFFATANEFRAWLREHAATERELVVGFYKVGSGRPSMTWPDSVDEALCFGWIDGVRTRIDEHAYKIRFTPRRRNSIWSAVNIAKAEALIVQGRMEADGLAAFEQRTERRSKVYSYEQGANAGLTAAEIRLFRTRKAAWAYFDGVAPSYRKAITHWVTSAKRPATRARRLAALIDACSQKVRLLK